MNGLELKRILISFADKENDVIIDKGKLFAVIRGDAIEADLEEDADGSLYIIEGGVKYIAIHWIAKRIANLHQLAERILDYIPVQPNFIDPNGLLLEDIEIDPSETEKEIESVTSQLCKSLNKKIFGTSKIVYITSDAGEGKTTLINELARKQANDFKLKKVANLIIPIPLGGRPFLRFDDIVVASLVNHLRFRLFYYDSFLELVKLGLIIPAFDGFEEMFMESSSGEALSATGNLISKLNSSGVILIAARKAYFDYKSFSSQAKLFDTIGGNSVSFSKLSIKRWDKDQFLLYATGRGIENPDAIYTFVKERIGNDENHPLLTRPVLINQLLDVVGSTEGLDLISNSLKGTSNYFPKFVQAIVEREANTKWIDKSGEPYKPLLSLKQHYEILSLLAEEMWINNTDTLQESVLDLIAEIYSDSNDLNVVLSRQVKERLKQHALIVKSDLNQNQFKFDHDEFREFFLGNAIYYYLNLNKPQEVKNLLRKGPVPYQSIDTIISLFENDNSDKIAAIKTLSNIQQNEGPTSFIRENNGALIIKLLNNQDGQNVVIDNCLFPANSLINNTLKNVLFKNCYFQITLLKDLVIENCEFLKCTFDRLEFNSNNPWEINIKNTKIIDSEINCVQNIQGEISYYDPYNINKILKEIGFALIYTEVQKEEVVTKYIEPSEDMELVERALRRFLRSTFLNDNIFKMRLGTKADYFIRDLLPILIDNKILAEIDYQGAGNKRRFKLAIAFDKINNALLKSEGDFNEFINLAKS